MLSGRMDIALHQPNRAVTQNRRQRGKVNTSLREAGCEGMAEVVKDECERDPLLCRGFGSCSPIDRLAICLQLWELADPKFEGPSVQ